MGWKRKAGIAMLAAPFVALGGVGSYLIGPLTMLGVTAGSGALLGWLYVAVRWSGGDD